MFTLEKYSEILTYRVKALTNLIPKASKAWMLFKKSADITTSEGGKGVLVPVIAEYFFGYGGDVPPQTITPDALGLTFPFKKIYGRLQIRRPDYQIMKNDPNAEKIFTANFNNYVNIFETSFLHYCNKIAHSDGTGINAIVAANASNSTKVYVNSYHSDNTLYPDDALLYLWKNLIVDFINPSTGAVRVGEKKIVATGKDDNGYFITLDSAVTVNANDYIVTTKSYNGEPIGLLGIIDDGTVLSTYGGKSRASYPLLKATIIRGSAESPITLSRSLLLNLWQDMAKNGATKVTHILCSKGVSTKYAVLSTDITRIVFERRPPVANLGLSGFVWTHPDGYEVPVIVDPFMPEGRLYMINADSLKVSYASEFEWITNREGSIFESVVNAKNEDLLVATGCMVLAIYSNAPNQNGAIINIDISE